MSKSTVTALEFAYAWLEAEDAAGREYGPTLLSLPTGKWRLEMNRDQNLRRYGTLRFVLEAIHADISHYPVRALERATVVVDFAKHVGAPVRQYAVGLHGLAWKEYANSLKYTGSLKKALRAAREAQRIFGQVGSFACDAAKARLVEALVHRELGNLNVVLSMAQECAKVFGDHDDAQAYVHARMTEALALADAHRHEEAMAIFSTVADEAEARGDRHTLAVCLHNAADCARALGDVTTARELDRRALAHFDAIGTAVEKPRIRWTEAMILVSEGRVSEALLELYKARAELASLGMNIDAAAYGLDVVRIRYERGEDVTSDCAHLVQIFMDAGMVQNALEALAYLREQARAGTISVGKINHVREFLVEHGKGGARLFLPPPDADGGGGA